MVSVDIMTRSLVVTNNVLVTMVGRVDWLLGTCVCWLVVTGIDRLMMSNMGRLMMSSIGRLMMRYMGRLVDNSRGGTSLI